MKHKRYGRNIVDLGQTLKVQVGKSFVDAVGIADTNCKGIHGHGLVEGLHIFGTNQEGAYVKGVINAVESKDFYPIANSGKAEVYDLVKEKIRLFKNQITRQ